MAVENHESLSAGPPSRNPHSFAPVWKTPHVAYRGRRTPHCARRRRWCGHRPRALRVLRPSPDQIRRHDSAGTSGTEQLPTGECRVTVNHTKYRHPYTSIIGSGPCTSKSSGRVPMSPRRERPKMRSGLRYSKTTGGGVRPSLRPPTLTATRAIAGPVHGGEMNVGSERHRRNTYRLCKAVQKRKDTTIPCACKLSRFGAGNTVKKSVGVVLDRTRRRTEYGVLKRRPV